jgi:mono/diheme cytochrome c family protein
MKVAHLGIILAALALCGALLVVGAFTSVDSPEPDPQPEIEQAYDPELARAYVDAGCWRCHMVSTLDDELTADFGQPAAGARATGPDLAGVANRFHRDWHAAHLWRPEWAYADSQMPAQRHLFEPGRTGTPQLNELGRNVVEFLMTLNKPSTFNKPWPTEPATAPAGYHLQGRDLFERECASCHGVSGKGDGPAAMFFIASRKPANLRQGDVLRTYDLPRYRDAVYTAITNGVPGTGMPAFHERLSKQQRADIAAYLARLGSKE